MPIDFTTNTGRVRLLLNDIDESAFVFLDSEIAAFLAIEGDNVKLAAAQAIDTNADNEALASKVLRSQDVQTDGAKVADSLRKRAAALREQAQKQIDVDVEADGGGCFTVDDMACAAELDEYAYVSVRVPRYTGAPFCY